MKTARKGVGMYRLDVEGRASHAGGAPGGGAHADHEHILVDALVDRAALLAGLLERIVAPPSA